MTWYVDNVKSSYSLAKINDDFKNWYQEKYGRFGDVKAVWGNKHQYLAMMLNYSDVGKLKVIMTDYINNMSDDFPLELRDDIKVAWSENLFKVNQDSTKLGPPKTALFHTFVMKCMFLSKHARPDISPAISFLSTCVKLPTK